MIKEAGPIDTVDDTQALRQFWEVQRFVRPRDEDKSWRHEGAWTCLLLSADAACVICY